MKFLGLLLLVMFSIQARAGVVRQFEAVVGETPASVAAAKAGRAYLLIQNKCASAVYLQFNSAPDEGELEGIKIPASGGSYEPYVVPYGAVYMYSASGDCAVTIIEG